MTRKWIELNVLSNGQYSLHKNITFKTPLIRSDYSYMYIVVKGTIDLLAAATKENDKGQKEVMLRNNAPFTSCISKINNTFKEISEDLDIAMPMYTLLEHTHQEVCRIVIEMK